MTNSDNELVLYILTSDFKQPTQLLAIEACNDLLQA